MPNAQAQTMGHGGAVWLQQRRIRRGEEESPRERHSAASQLNRGEKNGDEREGGPTQVRPSGGGVGEGQGAGGAR
jgi:hypothetical protein